MGRVRLRGCCQLLQLCVSTASHTCGVHPDTKCTMTVNHLPCNACPASYVTWPLEGDQSDVHLQPLLGATASGNAFVVCNDTTSEDISVKSIVPLPAARALWALPGSGCWSSSLQPMGGELTGCLTGLWVA